MPTILITGFGRFPGSPVNPSGAVATRLARRRRPGLAGTRRITHVFATRYDAVDAELAALIAREQPDIVMMFGVHGRAREVRIEGRARNRIALLPDAGRRRPPALTIARGTAAVRNALPLSGLVTAARATGVATVASRNAGSYLCNYSYWHGLQAAAQPGGPQLVIFVHIPPVATAARPAGRSAKAGARRRRPDIAALVRAGEAILCTLMAQARGGARSARPLAPEARPGP